MGVLVAPGLRRYYANCRTQEVQWEAPPLPPTANEELLAAAAAGDAAAVAAACARGADVNEAVNAHGDTALAVAAAYGHVALVCVRPCQLRHDANSGWYEVTHVIAHHVSESNRLACAR